MSLYNKIIRLLTGGRKGKSKVRENIQLVCPNYFNRHVGRDFLVLGTGPTLQEYSDRIRTFVQSKNLVVIGVNNVNEVIIPHYLGFTNRYRFQQFGKMIDSKKTRALLSIYFTDEQISNLCTAPYDLVMWQDSDDPDVCKVDKNGIISQRGPSGCLMMLVAYVMGANQVFMAGMDGYNPTKTLTATEDRHFKPKTYKANVTEENLDRKYRYWFDTIGVKTYAAMHNWITVTGKQPFVSLTPTYYGDFFDPKLLFENKDNSS